MSPIVIRILDFMYNRQFVNVYFNNSYGNHWKLRNGVRQGSIISPILFNFYINDVLSTVLDMDCGFFF